MMATAIRRFILMLHKSWVSGSGFAPLASRNGDASHGADVCPADMLVSYPNYERGGGSSGCGANGDSRAERVGASSGRSGFGVKLRATNKAGPIWHFRTQVWDGHL